MKVAIFLSFALTILIFQSCNRAEQDKGGVSNVTSDFLNDSVLKCNDLILIRNYEREAKCKARSGEIKSNLDNDFKSNDILKQCDSVNFTCFKNDSLAFIIIDFHFKDSNAVYNFKQAKQFRQQGSSYTEAPEYFIINFDIPTTIKMIFYYEEKYDVAAKQVMDCYLSIK